jgi:predicted nucleic acid-binding Zn ribbon protein
VKPLHTAVKQFVKDLGLSSKLEQYEAVNRWGEVVGTRIAQETEAVRIEKGVLVVKVKSSVWRNELNVRKREIIERLNTALGQQVVNDIRFQ